MLVDADSMCILFVLSTRQFEIGHHLYFSPKVYIYICYAFRIRIAESGGWICKFIAKCSFVCGDTTKELSQICYGCYIK